MAEGLCPRGGRGEADLYWENAHCRQSVSLPTHAAERPGFDSDLKFTGLAHSFSVEP